jgi:hypothetical protein
MRGDDLMRGSLLLCATLLAATSGADSAAAQTRPENRCGWYQNPSPANHWLTDGRGRWIIGSQGGFQALGIDKIRQAPRTEWVTTHPNGSYGYGCTCMVVRTDAANSRILQIYSSRLVPLANCRRDGRLREPR